MSKIEKEFSEIQAAQLVREANELSLASDKGKSLSELEYDYNTPCDMYELFSVLDSAGWRTSSMGC